MSVAATAFMYAAIACSAGALAFLAGQRASGRTSKEVEGCYEQGTLLEGVARDLRELHAEAERTPAAEHGRAELANARERLDDAISTLQRGADAVV